MLLEDILLALAVGVVLLVVGVPIVRFLKVAAPSRPKDPHAEAQERLRVAKLEAEAARVNREADEIYEHLYDEAIADNRGEADARRRVATDEEAAPSSETSDELPGKGKRHGQG